MTFLYWFGHHTETSHVDPRRIRWAKKVQGW